MKCEGWCLPAIIYVVLAVISLLLALLGDFTQYSEDDAYKARLAIFIFHFVWVIFWTWILYSLCSYCHEGWAWFILLLPFIIGLAVLAFGTALILGMVVGESAKKGFTGESYDNYY